VAVATSSEAEIAATLSASSTSAIHAEVLNAEFVDVQMAPHSIVTTNNS